ncbi:DNA repair and recombination protein RadB [Methanobrevibacter curvatus]|uniref:DNA repair and recombination protein RadB n=1 Tax=Methanobrevibacter curvatus TaxID=49547 RepID=A0A166BV27_9EURY|nr:DNA repair and recombination protein RadB [Methanobrevibacter curvatus]KZX13844.1 protein RecA [Methanobrevibacter curvatus]
MKSLSNFSKSIKIPSNSPIDDIIGGGIEKGIITQIYGPPTSGKTNISLQLAVNSAEMGKKVIYIDTEGGISIDRIRQIAKNDFDSFASNFIIFEPLSFSSQHKDLKIVDNWLKTNSDDVDLVIIDSIIALYRIVDNSKEVNQDLGKQMGLLSKISKKYNLAVLITNQIYSSFDVDGTNNSVVPAGGITLQYWSKNIIELSKTEIIGERIAKVIRHRIIPEGVNIKFQITSNGIE